MSLAGKRIVIIGGGSGTGLATAKLAAQMGAELVIAGRSKEKLDKACVDLGCSVEARTLDIRREDEVKEFFAGVGDFDHLTTPGTLGVRGSVLELDTQTARDAFDSKFWGQYMAAKYAAPHLRPGGSIVFVSGVYGVRPPRRVPVLAAINGGVEGLARALAVDLAPLRINVVAPGMLDTPLYDAMAPEARQAMFDELAARLPVGRIGTGEDAAKAILYLMDDGYVTGTTLRVDGGLSLR